jgi:hypothetical protein
MIGFCRKGGLIALQLDLQIMKQPSIVVWGQILYDQGTAKMRLCVHCIWLVSLMRNIFVRWLAFSPNKAWSLFSLICRQQNIHRLRCKEDFSTIRGTTKMNLRTLLHMIGLFEEEYHCQMICFCPKQGLIALELNVQTRTQPSIEVWGQILNNQGDSKNELMHIIPYDWPLWGGISLSDDWLLTLTRVDHSSAWFVDNKTTINCGAKMPSQQSGGQQKWAYALFCI